MLANWVVLTEYQKNPKHQPGSPYYGPNGYYIQVPTGKIRCPDCYFTTYSNDPFGTHVCPELKDGYGTKFTVGDPVYVFAASRIRKATVLKWNQTTKKLTVLEITEGGDEVKHVMNDLGKVLKHDDEG